MVFLAVVPRPPKNHSAKQFGRAVVQCHPTLVSTFGWGSRGKNTNAKHKMTRNQFRVPSEIWNSLSSRHVIEQHNPQLVPKIVYIGYDGTEG